MKDIDLVIPMVFPDDAQWQQDYARAHGNAVGAQRNVRFRSWGTEELLVRCCMSYMPWVRTIFILLARESQARPWMTALAERPQDALPAVRLVMHREFMPAHVLPCFNVNTIEMFLHRIPGLGEQFIYSNDDFFPLSPLPPEDFFRDGLPCQHHDEKPYPAGPNTFQRFVKNGLDMVAADFGRRFPRTWLRGGHSMQPMLRSAVEKVCTLHADRIGQSFTLARSPKNFNQYVFAFWQHLSGQYVDHVPPRHYVGPKTPTKDIAAVIRDPLCGIVCLNDNKQILDWQKRAAIVRREIEEKLEKANENNNENKKDMEVLIIHYNTPEMTAAAIRSLWKHTPGARVTVFDNSDRLPFQSDGIAGRGTLTVIDNTRGQVTDWEKWLSQFPRKKDTTANNWASAKHCYSVELCLDRFPDGFVLMDSDVLVKQDISDIVDRGKAFTGEESVPVKRFPVPRVLPMLCWVNTPMLREKGIRYFNAEKMWKLTMKSPDCYYDTGAWLLEAVRAAGLPYGKIVLDDYILHLGSGSWSRRKNPSKWLEEHRELWDDAPAETPTEQETPPARKATPENTRIFICTHADFEPVVKNPVYEVVDSRKINGGRCRNGLRQSFYSELFQYRHIAERDDLPEYVGVCHYRRYFSFMDDVPDMEALFREYDAVTSTPIRVKVNVRSQYGRCHNVKDLDIVSNIIRRDYPDLYPVYERSLYQPMLYACNMLILRRDDFRWIVSTVFDILDKYLEVVGTDIEHRIMKNREAYHIGRPQTGTVQYQYRIGAFLSERIINALLPYRFPRIRHFDKVVTAESMPQKVALCGIGRMENRYAREWVEHHLSQGFDHVIIYDNNRDGEERFEEVLQDYIDEGRVEIIDYRNRELAQIPAYNDCYRRYGSLYEWIAFLDFDEFLMTDRPVHAFLSEYRDTDCLLVNWRVMTDSGLVRYDDRPLRERFTVPLDNGVLMQGRHPYNDHVKSIVRGGLQVDGVFSKQMMHVPKPVIRCCTTDHRAVGNSPWQPCDHSRARIDHYTTKTLDEWLHVKYARGFPISITDQWREEWCIPQFFEINERTEEKEQLLQEWRVALDSGAGKK